MTTPIDVILRFVKTGQGAEQARAALKGLGDSANRADIEMSAMGATAQASQRKLQQLGDEVARGKKSVEQATREWKEYQGAISSGKIPQAEKQAQSFGQQMLTVGAAIGTVAIAAKRAYEFLGEGAELEAARGRFENLTVSIGTTADAMLGNLRAATKGMVADAELMASASQIISLGLSDNEEGVTRLATVISALGLDMQQVILTFANNSTARLDALGLSITDVKSKAAELQRQGFTGDAFDEAVLIALEEKMQLLGDASQTSAGKLRILESNWQNLTDRMKEDLAGALEPAVSLLVALGEYGDQVAPVIEENIKAAKSFDDLANEARKLDEVGDIWGGIGPAITGTSDEIRDGIINVSGELAVAANSFDQFEGVIGSWSARSQNHFYSFLRAQGLTIEEFYNQERATRVEAEALAELVAQTTKADRVLLNTAGTFRFISAETLAAANAASSYDTALLQNYSTIQQSNLAEQRWALAMANSKDLLEESSKVAAAAAAQRAQIAAATGDLFTQFSEADGALKFYNESLDELGQQYVAVGGRTAEQSADLERLQGAYDKAEQTIRDYELGIKGANLSDEARAEKITEQQQLMAGLAANMQPLLGIQSELVSVNNALSINQDAVNQAMYAAADAAGADAAQLAILKVATGELSPVQAEAVIKSVALQQTLENLGKQYAEGDLTLQGYINAAQQAVQDINSMTVSFNEQTGAVTTANAEAAALIDTLGLLPTHHDFVIKITTDGTLPTLPTGPGSSQRVAANAEGGPITGGMPYTGPGPDNVIIGAQTGEYMLKRSAVQKLGLNRLNYMNNTGRLPGYADGGVIGSDSGGGSAAGASIVLQPVIQVTGVVSRQQGIESGRNILDGLVDAARGRGVRI